MDKYPKSKNLIREEIDGYYITTASWDSGYGPCFETGVRNLKNKTFTLVQHSGCDYEQDHEKVKALLISGCPPQDLSEKLSEPPAQTEKE